MKMLISFRNQYFQNKFSFWKLVLKVTCSTNVESKRDIFYIIFNYFLDTTIVKTRMFSSLSPKV